MAVYNLLWGDGEAGQRDSWEICAQSSPCLQQLPEENYSSCQWYHAGREDTLNRDYHLLSSHPCKQAALKQTNRGLGGHMPSERALFSLFVFLPFCVTTMLGMTSEVSEISCLQKENLKVWHARACSHAQITSFSNNKVSENDNQIPRVTESISAVAGVTQDGN